jgi:protein-tyrosine phosphatase
MGYEPKWVIDGILAKSSRPGHRSENVSIDTVESWIEKAKNMEINSIICFLAERQLDFYSGIPSGLLEYYRKSGFEVLHLPEKDYLSPPLSEETLKRAVSGFEELEKPVLIHCSAGIDRTGLAIRTILDRVTIS